MVKGEHDVVRPIASIERYEATRLAMRSFQSRYADEMRTLDRKGDRARAERRLRSWIRAELALFLIEATGRRRSSIVGLAWSDFDHTAQRVTWRPEHDKKRKTWVVPLLLRSSRPSGISSGASARQAASSFRSTMIQVNTHLENSSPNGYGRRRTPRNYQSW
jgi:hypothetical protein